MRKYDGSKRIWIISKDWKTRKHLQILGCGMNIGNVLAGLIITEVRSLQQQAAM
jgi:hypothetical protein